MLLPLRQPGEQADPALDMLSAAQLAEFDEEGVVLVQAGLTPAELADAEATWDRLVLGDSPPPSHEDEGFLRLISHPWFEAAAKAALRAEEVRLIELGPTNRPPSDEPQAPPEAQRQAWASGAHIDLQISTADWEATPRRDLLALWFWVNDVSADRAAMRVLPGSHRPIMQHWDAVLGDDRKAQLPRCHGAPPTPPPTLAKP